MAKKRKRSQHKRKEKSGVRGLSSLHMAVAAYPSARAGNVSIAEEVGMLKPAVLYADRITLYSPAAELITNVSSTASPPASRKLDTLVEVWPRVDRDKAKAYYEETIRDIRDLRLRIKSALQHPSQEAGG